MLCKVLLVSLVLAAVAVRVLLASVACASAGGSCESMSINKALSDPAAGQLEHEVVHAVVEKTFNSQDTRSFICHPPSDSQPEVRNLSVSLFPNAEYVIRYNLLIQWISDGNSDGYVIQLMKEEGHKFYKTQIGNPMVTSVLLKEVSHYPNSHSSLSIQVQPNSRSGSSNCASITVSVPAGLCDAFVYNQHCSQRVQQSTPDIAEFQVQTTLLSSYSQLMSMHVSWETRDRSVMIALTTNGQKNTDCSKPGRQPPCFIASNTNSVTVSSLNASTNYTVTLHIFDPSPCHPNLAHLLNGCSNGYCCKSYSPMPLPLPTNATSTYTTPTPSSVNTLVTTSQENSHTENSTEDAHTEDAHTEDAHTEDSRTEDAHTEDAHTEDAHTESSHTENSHTEDPHTEDPHTEDAHTEDAHTEDSRTEEDAHTEDAHTEDPHTEDAHTEDAHRENLRAVYNDSISKEFPSGLVIVAIAVPLVIIVVSVVIIAVAVILYKVSKKRKRRVPPTHVITTNSPIVECTSTTTLNNFELSPVKPLKSQSNPIRCVSPDNPSVVVLYSPKTPTVEIEDILGTLVMGLCQYGINAKSPDTCVSDSISAWLEREVENSIVLLVCNEALKSDWECERPTKLVCSLRQLLHGSLVNRGLSKFATVFMGKDAESGYVPSAYLMPQNQFTVRDISDVDEISHFVFKIPRYEASF